VISEMTDYMQDGSRFPSEAGIFVLATVSISVVGGKPATYPAGGNKAVGAGS